MELHQPQRLKFEKSGLAWRCGAFHCLAAMRQGSVLMPELGAGQHPWSPDQISFGPQRTAEQLLAYRQRRPVQHSQQGWLTSWTPSSFVVVEGSSRPGDTGVEPFTVAYSARQAFLGRTRWKDFVNMQFGDFGVSVGLDLCWLDLVP